MITTVQDYVRDRKYTELKEYLEKNGKTEVPLHEQLQILSSGQEHLIKWMLINDKFSKSTLQSLSGTLSEDNKVLVRLDRMN